MKTLFKTENFDKAAANPKAKPVARYIDPERKEKVTNATVGLMSYFKEHDLTPIESMMAATMFLEFMKEQTGLQALAILKDDSQEV